MANKSKAQQKNKMSEIDDQILDNYDIKKRLGKGAYGIVWKCIDKKTTQTVAVKKIFDAFRNETDAQRTYREIMFLRAFREHPNVVQLFSVHRATNNMDIYLAFEFMESDLHNVIKRGNILKDIHKRFIMYQLFNAVKYIHSGNVIHRDLKPSNVLIDSKCRCKIADFGLARSVSQRPTGNSTTSVDPTEPILTDYVATRWYRAPEILIASKRYTKGIDMWSLGCILGEMIRGKPLFPGSSTVNQIEKIVASLPEITEDDIQAIGSGFGSVLLNQQNNNNGSNLSIDDLLAGASDDAKHLIKSLLILDPAARLTAKVALAHKYIEKFRHSINETELNTDILPPLRDDIQLTVPEYRSKLYEIIQTTEKVNGNHNNDNEKSTSVTKTNNIIGKKKDTNAPRIENSTKHNMPSKIEKASLTSKINDYQSKYIENKMIKANQAQQYSTLLQQQNCSYNHYHQHHHHNHTVKSSKKFNSQSTQSTMNHKNSNLAVTNLNNSANETVKLEPIVKNKYHKNSVSSENNKTNVITSPSIDNQQIVKPHKYSEGNINNTNSVPNKKAMTIEKRHSIDCAYNCQQQQQSFKNKMNLNGSLSNLSNNNNNKYKSNEINLSTIIGQNLLNRNGPKFSPQTPKSNSQNYKNIYDESSSVVSNDGGSTYYEKRLKNLEEKIQKHKMDIKALFNENRKYRGYSKNDLLASDFKIKTKSTDEKLLRSKLTITRGSTGKDSGFIDYSGDFNPPLLNKKYEYASGKMDLFRNDEIVT